MARLARITPAGVPAHLIQRGNNRQVCFASGINGVRVKLNPMADAIVGGYVVSVELNMDCSCQE